MIGLDENTITIEYKDGSTKIMEIGRRFGVVAGSTVPHSVVTNLKLGEKFKAGDTIIYNENFFTPDHFNPKQVIWKAGILVKTAILESPDTLEDSSAISERAAQALRTTMTKVRSIRLRFDQSVRNLVKTGQSVDVESILCNIEDSITADNDLFDDESLETLNLLSSQSPKAKANGVVERIEVFYNGDKEDMSDSLRKIVNASDREMLARTKAKSSSGKGYTGRVDNTMRVDGKPLELDQLVINIYITGPVPAGVGDKGVFGNQMKTVFGRVMTGINETESGEPIDAIFGYQSISDRIVNSPMIIGTTNTLLKVLSKKVAKIYRGDKS